VWVPGAAVPNAAVTSRHARLHAPAGSKHMVELLTEHEARLALAQKERKVYKDLYEESQRLQTQYFKDLESSRRECERAMEERDQLTTTLRRVQGEMQV
jgi:hypothetical protein